MTLRRHKSGPNHLPGLLETSRQLQRSYQHVALVLKGERVSPNLLAAVEVLNPWLAARAASLRSQNQTKLPTS